MRALLVAGGTALVLLAACGDRTGTGDQPAGPVVPFVPAPAELPALDEGPAPDDVPECRADQLSLAIVTEAEVLGSPGFSMGPPENRNLAIKALPGERCAIRSWPVVRVEPAEGAAGPLQPEQVGPADRILMEGRQRIVGVVRWYSSCAPPGEEVLVAADVAGGGTLTAALPDAPPCEPARPSSGGFFMAFREPPPPLPLEASFVDLPATLPYGGVARVVVRLRNPGEAPFPLAPCPLLTISYGESGTSVHETHTFNCAAAPAEIAPGGALDFAAELALPAEEVPDGFEGTVTVEVRDAEGSSAAVSQEIATD